MNINAATQTNYWSHLSLIKINSFTHFQVLTGSLVYLTGIKINALIARKTSSTININTYVHNSYDGISSWGQYFDYNFGINQTAYGG